MSEVWADAVVAARILAADPLRIGGAVVKARPGPVLDAWLAIAGGGKRLRRIPAGVGEDRLLGGLDLGATLAAGRPVAQAGILAESDGGVLVLPMAERATRAVAAYLCSALDLGAVAAHRDGVSISAPARFGLIAIDESTDEEAGIAEALADRLALHIDLSDVAIGDIADEKLGDDTDNATATREHLETLTGVALSLGIGSLRAPILAVRVAEIAAGLAGQGVPDADDLSLAARLVLAPRATRMPAPPEDEEEAVEEEPETDQPPDQAEDERLTPDQLDEIVLEAALAVLPDDLLKSTAKRGAAGEGRAGASEISLRRGRPLTSRKGDPRQGRLDVLATLRAAVPWQRLRGRKPGAPIAIRRDDFMVKRFRHNTESAMVFVVDASGSAAAQRLGEVKGAIELLLGEAYVRRDTIALVTMRGEGAELALPPTKALAAAKRRLAGLPGGGGTPMASGIDLGIVSALDAKRRGFAPTLILLTDGKANIARDGTPGRPQAMEDALQSARMVRATGIDTILIDTSPRPNAAAETLAQEMGARYAPLPFADARRVSDAVRGAL